MKMLLWLAIGFLIVMWILHTKKVQRRAGAATGARPAVTEPENMIRCQHCGIFIPSSEAIVPTAGGPAYCSEDHRRRHPV